MTLRFDLPPGLALRPLRASDLDALVELDADPEVVRYVTGGAPVPRSAYEAGVLDRLLAPGRADPRLGFFAVEVDGAFRGWVHLRPDAVEPAWLEVGYRLRRAVWGRGLATTAAGAVMAYAERVFPGRGFSARAAPENAASRRVMEKLGLRWVGDVGFPERTFAGVTFPAQAGVLYRRAGLRLALDPGAVALLREPTDADPWRVLLSGCLAGLPVGVDGHDYGLGGDFAGVRATPRIRWVTACPEAVGLGVPRPMPDLHGGDGLAVLEGAAAVRAPDGADLTEGMVRGARAMVDVARAERVDFAVLTDASAACGSQVLSLGCRFDAPRRFQRGLGVAAAALLRAGVPIVAARDHATLGRLRRRADPAFVPDPSAVDHHAHPWVLAHFPGAARDPWGP